MRGSGLPFSSRPWRVQDFDISVVCGIEVKLRHNLPRRGSVSEPATPSAAAGTVKNLSCEQEPATGDRN
jgi:hypothetical protein